MANRVRNRNRPVWNLEQLEERLVLSSGTAPRSTWTLAEGFDVPIAAAETRDATTNLMNNISVASRSLAEAVDREQISKIGVGRPQTVVFVDSDVPEYRSLMQSLA